MFSYQDLNKLLAMTTPHTRKLANLVTNHKEPYTQEEVDRMLAVRAKMKAGELTWKQLEALAVNQHLQQPTSPHNENSSTPAISREVDLQVIRERVRATNLKTVNALFLRDMQDLLSYSGHFSLAAAFAVLDPNGEEVMNQSEEEAIDVIWSEEKIDMGLPSFKSLPFNRGKAISDRNLDRLSASEEEEEDDEIID